MVNRCGQTAPVGFHRGSVFKFQPAMVANRDPSLSLQGGPGAPGPFPREAYHARVAAAAAAVRSFNRIRLRARLATWRTQHSPQRTDPDLHSHGTYR